ncbi:17328_t:CDS:2 [Gigaspora margarita]|uniref:DNA topoisomerase I n=1 Tax=Gigaspora margarita TaxID=4874 RepID=A0ABN7UTZ6_GIGMA|nr:17328_t:CDS:2 [Gigaspora margarita]
MSEGNPLNSTREQRDAKRKRLNSSKSKYDSENTIKRMKEESEDSSGKRKTVTIEANEVKQEVKAKRKRNDSDSEVDIKKQKEDSSNKEDKELWTTLEHNGVYFPPPYVPHNVKMKYDGKEITLEPEAEEVASFYAAMLGTNYVPNETFNRNFFKDWIKVIKKSKNVYNLDFEKCDFTPICEYLEQEKERKKNMSKEEKAKLKEEKIKLEEKYGYCLLDGRKEKVDNFHIEPPGLFRRQVQPEQVTINISKGAKIPSPPEGHKWAGVVHNPTVNWLATWKDINGKIKYVYLAANSSLRGLSDEKKFEKARELKQHIDKIRNDYQTNLRHKNTDTCQMATVMYLIDHLALRVGNEKDTNEEADTVGCCSLRPEHINLIPPNTVKFEFLGKDSIEYINTVEVEDQVFRNLSIFMEGKDERKDLLFDKVNPQKLNKHLSSYMTGLTAKVFRTFNVSTTFQTLLKKLTNDDMSIDEKKKVYNQALQQVLDLCNHQQKISTQSYYIDPRISVAWCLKHCVPYDDETAPNQDHLKHSQSDSGGDKDKSIEKGGSDSTITYQEQPQYAQQVSKILQDKKIFNKSLCNKFKWGMNIDADWVCKLTH